MALWSMVRRLFVRLVISCCRCNCFSISDVNKKICPSPFIENAGSGLLMSCPRGCRYHHKDNCLVDIRWDADTWTHKDNMTEHGGRGTGR